MKTSTLWLWVFSMVCGCLPAEGALDETAANTRVLSLNVRDTHGGRWPLDAVPRAAHLELELDAPPDQLEKRMWLVTGSLDARLAEDLRTPPLRAVSRARVVETLVRHSGPRVMVSTVAPLIRGERYTLVVLEAPEQLWSQELRVSESPASGARFVEGAPADQARGVPPNLASMLLRFDGYLKREVRVSLRADSRELEAKASVRRCSELGLPEGDCMTVRPTRPLPAQTWLLLEVSELSDATGASIAPLSIRFETAGAEDTQAPGLVELTCALDERALDHGGCVLEQDRALLLRLAVEEPVLATLTTAHELRSALSFGRDVELALSDLEPDLLLPSSLSLTDVAGNTRTIALALATQPQLASLSIDEVRSDPLGPEPAQETIELLNFGGEPIQIMGFSVSDDAHEAGVRIRDPLSVLPGERVLVVGPEFDARDASDGILPPGVRLVRTDKALSLNNQGSALFLRDPQTRRLSAAPRMKPAQAGACVTRISTDPRTGALAGFAPDPSHSCTPGTETRWP